jgi:hypothetical protein
MAVVDTSRLGMSGFLLVRRGDRIQWGDANPQLPSHADEHGRNLRSKVHHIIRALAPAPFRLARSKERGNTGRPPAGANVLGRGGRARTKLGSQKCATSIAMNRCEQS